MFFPYSFFLILALIIALGLIITICLVAFVSIFEAIADHYAERKRIRNAPTNFPF